MISINATLIVQIINLLVLIFILNRIMYRPIKKIAAQREEKLSRDQAEIERIAAETQTAQETYLEEIREGRHQVRNKLNALKEETEREALAIIQKAHDKAKVRETEIREKIEEQVGLARKDISKEAQSVAINMAGVLLGREVS